MSGRFYTSLLAAATIFSWTAFFSLIFFINPSGAGLLGIGILNASLLLGLLGAFALIRIGLVYSRKGELNLGSNLYYFLSFLVAIFFIVMFYLSHAGLISLQNIFIVLLVFAVLAFFGSRKLLNGKK